MMEIVGFITTATIVFVFAIMAMVKITRYFNSANKLPKLAGAVVPEIGQGLDMTKSYDIVYSGGDYGAHFAERLLGVRILGYVGNESDENIGKMYMRSRWLVVEFADKRRAYLMPRSIVSLVESQST